MTFFRILSLSSPIRKCWITAAAFQVGNGFAQEGAPLGTGGLLDEADEGLVKGRL